MRAQFVFEKFEDITDPIRDMGIGGNVNFEKAALKTIRNMKAANRSKKWSKFLTSTKGKSISGIFEKVPYARGKVIGKTNRITFVISDYNSYLDGTEIYLYDKKTEATSSADATYNIYRVLPEENYLIN